MQQQQQQQHAEAEAGAGMQRSPCSSMKHRLGLTAEERASSDLLQQSPHPWEEGVVVRGRRSMEGEGGAHRGRLASRVVDEGTSPTAARRQLEEQSGSQTQQQQHGQQMCEPSLQQSAQLEQQGSRRSLESLPSGSHQRIQVSRGGGGAVFGIAGQWLPPVRTGECGERGVVLEIPGQWLPPRIQVIVGKEGQCSKSLASGSHLRVQVSGRIGAVFGKKILAKIEKNVIT
eukprot:scaffold42081_cov17-Tisochrysis_lutea.AAC.4